MQLKLVRLRNIGGDLTWPKPGIYLHLVHQGGQLRLYIGQANNLKARVRNHMNPDVRFHRPSLHYDALAASDWDQFVVLAYYEDLDRVSEVSADQVTNRDIDQLTLNVAELWACCLFETLPKRVMALYLPFVKFSSPDIHLNLATPLSKGQPSKGRWGYIHLDLLKSSDPLKAAWGLRVLEKAQANSAATRSRQAAERALQKFENGGEYACTYVNKEGRRPVVIGLLLLNMPRNVILEESGNVFVVPELLGPESVHPNPVCPGAREGDPALRLGFRVKVELPDGTIGVGWLSNAGTKALANANKMVVEMDELRRRAAGLGADQPWSGLTRFENRLR
jgi:hypothetical protein